MKNIVKKLLLVEDETEQRQLIKSVLIAESFEVDEAESAESACQLIARNYYNVVISDWKLPGKNGDSILAYLKSHSPDSGFILITAHSDPSHAINMIRAGADDYLAKPFDKTSLLFTLKKLLYTQHIESENNQLKNQQNHRDKLVEMIGSSKEINKIYHRIEKTAPTNATILITGESGTGKELAARAIHQLSKRKNAPFIPVNCAAIPESLAEAELFGAEKGAFTGSDKKRIGVLEAANNGTLFLDEIGELPLLMQSKILRFLQEGKISRIGSNDELEVDVRIVAATNRELEEEVKENRFREDLFYRLNVIPIKLPPLRNRQEDILPLIQHFITRAINKHQLNNKEITSSALKALLQYSWPGNIRQLKNCIERLVLLSSSEKISLDDVKDLELTHSEKSNIFLLPPEGVDWNFLEKDCLIQALKHCNNNKTQAAKLLNLSYKAFLYRLEKFKIV